MQFVFSESAKKDIQKLPAKTQKNLKTKFTYWQNHPNSLHFAKPLTKHVEATHRFRIGVYRVLVKSKGKKVLVLRIRHRKNVYKR